MHSSPPNSTSEPPTTPLTVSSTQGSSLHTVGEIVGDDDGSVVVGDTEGDVVGDRLGSDVLGDTDGDWDGD